MHGVVNSALKSCLSVHPPPPQVTVWGHVLSLFVPCQCFLTLLCCLGKLLCCAAVMDGGQTAMLLLLLTAVPHKGAMCCWAQGVSVGGWVACVFNYQSGLHFLWHLTAEHGVVNFSCSHNKKNDKVYSKEFILYLQMVCWIFWAFWPNFPKCLSQLMWEKKKIN